MNEYIIKEQYNTITEQTRFIVCKELPTSYGRVYSPMTKEVYSTREKAEARLQELLIPHAWETVKCTTQAQKS